MKVQVPRAATDRRPLAFALVALLVVLFTLPISASGSTGSVTPRVIGGSDASTGAWPSQALIQVETESGISQCGGTLIDPEWVLTAAHCVTDENDDPYPADAAVVALGRQAISAITESDVWGVTGVEVHPWWNGAFVRWDLAMLRLETPSSQPVMPLIQPSQELATLGGKAARVAGWGCTSAAAGGCEEQSGYPDLLQEANVKFVSDAVCGSSRSWASTFDPRMMICAGSYGSGTPTVCSGDSGGPLVAFAGGGKVLAGVTSFGSAEPLCTARTRPGVFARVSAARSWIDSTLGRRARLGGLRLTPSRKTVRSGTTATFRVGLTNSGDAAGGARVRLSTGNVRKAKVAGSVSVEVDAGGSATRKVKVRTRAAKAGKVTLKARFGGAVARATVLIRR